MIGDRGGRELASVHRRLAEPASRKNNKQTCLEVAAPHIIPCDKQRPPLPLLAPSFRPTRIIKLFNDALLQKWLCYSRTPVQSASFGSPVAIKQKAVPVLMF